MIQAIWNGNVIAESEHTVKVEGNHYFPPESLRREYFENGKSKTVCPWKGLASYYTIVVDGKRNEDAGWYYPHPLPLARKIKGHVAFWQGVEVVDDTPRGSGNSVANKIRSMFGG